MDAVTLWGFQILSNHFHCCQVVLSILQAKNETGTLILAHTYQAPDIIDIADIISMDIKLPSIVSQPQWEAHRRFIEVAKAKDLYIKLVVAEETTEAEFRQAIDLVAETAPETLFIIQPVTPYGGVKAASPEKILMCQNYALTKLKDVRVIPQTHKFIGQI